jgi:hypothetical protein
VVTSVLNTDDFGASSESIVSLDVFLCNGERDESVHRLRTGQVEQNLKRNIVNRARRMSSRRRRRHSRRDLNRLRTS